MADWGVSPAQVIDFLALTGDAVDNVPGVPTIGPGYAKKLLQAYPNLEAALADIEGTGKALGKARQAKLRDHADDARRALHLVTLRDDVPIGLDWDALSYKGFDVKALRGLCNECGFHRFLDEIGDEPREPEKAWDYAYATVDTPEALAAFVAELGRQPKFCLDTETTALDPLRADLVGLSFSWKEGEAYYIPVRGPAWDRKLDESAVLEALRPALTSQATEKVGQNLKYDMLVLRRAGLEIGGPVTDTMVLSYLLESGERNHNLDQLSRRLLDHTMIPIAELIGKGKNQVGMDEVEVARVARYAGEDADATWRIEEILAPQVREAGLWDLYAELERPLIRILAEMEAAGRQGRRPPGSSSFRPRSSPRKIADHRGRRSTRRPATRSTSARCPQLRSTVLFEELKLPSYKKTPGGDPSTDVEVLEEPGPRSTRCPGS